MELSKGSMVIILSSLLFVLATITLSCQSGVSQEAVTAAEVLMADATPTPTAHYRRVADPYAPIAPHITHTIPSQLRPHSDLLLTDIEDRTFFDYFAWQTFIGLIWPADPDQRGKPLEISTEEFYEFNRSDGDYDNSSHPIIWETYRTADELFTGNNTDTPPEWNADPYTGTLNLAMLTKGHAPDLDEAFSSPLIDQNRQYVRYQVQINEVMYEYIRHNGWYLKENIPKMPTQARLPPLNGTPIAQPQTHTEITQPIPGNSIEIKSAWRIMITEKSDDQPWRHIDDLSRYYVVDANVIDVMTGETKTVKVGLVGLHIVEKTPQFTQGIWASFEHVDNISIDPTTNPPAGLRPSFNNGNADIKRGYSYVPPHVAGTATPEAHRDPVEVNRVWPIPDTPKATPSSPQTVANLPYGFSTQGLNSRYRDLLKGTVWQYYQLVITQWPTDPTSFYPKPNFTPRGARPGPDSPPAMIEAFKRAEQLGADAYPRWSGLPIPQVGALNTTMETYFQDSSTLENTSCMGCHYGASDTDYSWIVKRRTFPQPYNQGRIEPITGTTN